MSGGTGVIPNDLPEDVVEASRRSRTLRGKSLTNLHRWWARRDPILSRIGVYLALTEAAEPDEEFLTQLAADEPLPIIVNQAVQDVRDSQWRWMLREVVMSIDRDRDDLTDVQTPTPPRVLDPFAGGGALPFEAQRLRCETYASDLDPVAYHILQASLRYPSTLAAPSSDAVGSSLGTWAGLTTELRHAVARMHAITAPRIQHLYSREQLSDPGDRIHYLWLHCFKCSNVECSRAVPVRSSIPLSRRGRAPERILLEVRGSQIVPRLITQSSPAEPFTAASEVKCLFCGTVTARAALEYCSAPPMLIALIAGTRSRPTVMPVTTDQQDRIASWSDADAVRLDALLQEDWAHSLRSELPDDNDWIRSRPGFACFADLFTPRQLLVGLEYARAIHSLNEELQQDGFQHEHRIALLTYLSFFLGYLADHSSRLTHYGFLRGAPQTASSRRGMTIADAFIEVDPRWLSEVWLGRVIPTIDTCATVLPAFEVRRADACQLPFGDETFDAIITDPPYYDNIAYGEVSRFFWVWEETILARYTPDVEGLQVPRGLEEDAGTPQAHQQRLLNALRECHRVLKPGRQFAMLLPGDTRGRFQNYIAAAQEVGLELVDVKQVRRELKLLSLAEDTTFLAFFRKQPRTTLRHPIVVDTEAVLGNVEAGRPVLYEGLAAALLDYVDHEVIDELLPTGGKGSRLEQLMESLGNTDPRDLLHNTLGIAGIRKFSSYLDLSENAGTSRDTLSVVLHHFGFAIPSPAKIDGLEQALSRIREQRAQIRRAQDRATALGPFKDVCTAVERLLKIAVFGWMQLAFGPERDQRLLELIRSKQNDENKLGSLDRLAFGHTAHMIRELPEWLSQSDYSQIIEQKFGRKRLYNPKRLKVERLDDIINLRNRVEHNKDNYWSETPDHDIRMEMIEVLELVEELLSACADAHLIPRVGRATHEIRDEFNRITYRMELDDGDIAEFQSKEKLRLGETYLYYGTETNPKPVNPVFIEMQLVEPIP